MSERAPSKRPRLHLVSLDDTPAEAAAEAADVAAMVACMAASSASAAAFDAGLAAVDVSVRETRAAIVLQHAFHRIKMRTMRSKAVALWRMKSC